VRWWPLTMCFAAKMIQSFPGKLAFDDLSYAVLPSVLSSDGVPPSSV